MEERNQQKPFPQHQVGGSFADAQIRLECGTVTASGHSDLQEQGQEEKKKITCKDRMKKKRQQAPPLFSHAHQTCNDATLVFLSEMFRRHRSTKVEVLQVSY